MAKIVFGVFPEAGHIVPTLQLGHALVTRGHSVEYVGTESARHMVECHALPFRGLEGHPPPALSDSKTAPGRLRWFALQMLKLLRSSLNTPNEGVPLSEVIGGILFELTHNRPDLLLIDRQYLHVAEVARALDVPTLLYNTSLPVRRDTLAPPEDSSYVPTDDIWSQIVTRVAWHRAALVSRLHATRDKVLHPEGAALLRETLGSLRRSGVDTCRQQPFQELVFGVREFDWKRTDYTGLQYVGPAVDQERWEPEFDEQLLLPSAPLILTSLGTQAQRVRRAPCFYRTAIEAMERLQDWQMLICTGPHQHEFPRALPKNVRVVDHAPQLRLLRRASLMLTHGGFGTIKECILNGVPMIVFPTGFDQTGNAARVVYHNLGSRARLSISSGHLARLVRQVASDASIRASMAGMQSIFRLGNSADHAVRLVELALHPPRSRGNVPNTLERHHEGDVALRPS